MIAFNDQWNQILILMIELIDAKAALIRLNWQTIVTNDYKDYNSVSNHSIIIIIL